MNLNNYVYLFHHHHASWLYIVSFSSKERRFVLCLYYNYYDGRFYLLLCLSLLHQPADLKSFNYINLDSFFRLNKFVELLNDIYILAQNPFRAAFDEISKLSSLSVFVIDLKSFLSCSLLLLLLLLLLL